MNWGANVPAGVLFRFESERNRVESLRPMPGLLSWTSDWFRAWAMTGCGSASGEDSRADLGRMVAGVGP